MTTAPANQTTGLTSGRVANWAPEVEFSPLRAFRSSNDVPILLLTQPIVENYLRRFSSTFKKYRAREFFVRQSTPKYVPPYKI